MTTTKPRKLITEEKKQEVPKVNLTIDNSTPSSLMEQMKESPALFAYYANALEDAKFETAQAKVLIEKQKSAIASRMRVENSKVSEARIEKSYHSDSDYNAYVDRYNSRKKMEGKLAVIVRALEQRSAILMSITGLKRQELRQFGTSDL